VWLRVSGTLFLDGTGYLTVRDSVFGVAAGDPAVELLQYDYQRDKAGFPDAHIQVKATGQAWRELLSACGRSPDGLSKLHLPVGASDTGQP